MKRVFLAINLPSVVRYRLEAEVAELDEKIRNTDVRWLNSQGWHITIQFLGEQSAVDVQNMKIVIGKIAAILPVPDIKLVKIGGPIRMRPGSGEAWREPGMIWAVTDKSSSEALGVLQKNLSDVLRKAGLDFAIEHREFTGHITLAKFKEGVRLPEINLSLDISFRPESLDLMESHLTSNGSEYEILEKFNFRLE